MPVVVLEKVDNVNFTPSFNVGEHTIGRGSNLLCNSKKVSRNHGKLKITESDGVFLQSIHNNPCFYKKCNSTNISIVTFGNTIQIHDDDQIALSLDHGWFKVQIKDSVNATNNGDVQSTSSRVESVIEIDTNKDNLSHKREHGESNETESKRLKIVEANESSSSDAANTTTVKNEQTINVSTSESTSYNIISESEIKKEPLETNLDNDNRCDTSNNSDTVIKTEPVDDETENNNLANQKIDNNSDTAIKEEPPGANCVPIDMEIDNNIDTALDDTLQRNNDDTEKDVKEEKKDNKDDSCKNLDNNDKASTSGTNKRVWRDKCWYGSTCYRKNAAHRTELTHPGDSDYDTDPNDSRPICSYGVDCYRKNKEHRKRLQHPGQKKLGTKPPSQRKRRKVKKRNPSPVNSDLEDSYDGSFIDDGSSSDEYEPSEVSDTESDYEDEDDSQRDDRDLMLREARKFTRNK